MVSLGVKEILSHSQIGLLQGLNLNSCPFHIEVPLWDCWIMKCMYNNIGNRNVLFNSLGAVAIKTLNVSEPSPQQLQGFKNEVAVLRWVQSHVL